jgi:hypothetical protein
MTERRDDRDDLSATHEEKQEQVLEREGLETELMDAEASEVGEEIEDADAVRRADANERGGGG